MTSDDWAIDANEASEFQATFREATAKTFVKSVMRVSDQIGSETDMQNSSLDFFEDELKPKSIDGTEMYSTGLDGRLKDWYGLPKKFDGEPSPDELECFESYTVRC